MSTTRGHHTRSQADRQAGVVTIEAALVLPLLVMVIAMGLALLGVVGQQHRCDTAARSAATALSQGYSVPVAMGLAQRNSPAGAQVRIQRQGSLWQVQVSATAQQWPLSWWGVRWSLNSTVVATQPLPTQAQRDETE